MSHRPTQRKKLAALRRQLHKNAGATPSSIDLVQWLKDHGHARTSGEAESIILAGRVKSESHTLGIMKLYDPLKDRNREVVQRYVPAQVRPTLRVESA